MEYEQGNGGNSMRAPRSAFFIRHSSFDISVLSFRIPHYDFRISNHAFRNTRTARPVPQIAATLFFDKWGRTGFDGVGRDCGRMPS
jgi:hypothetical protein